jgi:hypothetical protein
MLRKRSLLICLTAVTFCSVGIALARKDGRVKYTGQKEAHTQAVKQELVSEEGEVLGKANLNYAKGVDRTKIRVKCWDLQRETEYVVMLFEIDGEENVSDCIALGSFSTDKKGMGRLHARVEGHVSNWSVLVGIDDAGTLVPCAIDLCRFPIHMDVGYYVQL